MSPRETCFVEFPVTWIERRKTGKGPSCITSINKRTTGGQREKLEIEGNDSRILVLKISLNLCSSP